LSPYAVKILSLNTDLVSVAARGLNVSGAPSLGVVIVDVAGGRLAARPAALSTTLSRMVGTTILHYRF
jgi:hypothetical protein